MGTDTHREQRFSRLVENHADAVHRYLRNRLSGGDGIDAEDVLADVMMIAWQRLDDIPPDAEAPWLFGVARNRLMNAHSKRSRRTAISRRIRPHGPSAPAEDVALADLGLRGALDALPGPEREALMLTAWEGLTPNQLAVALGVSVNAAAIRLSRAKSMLLEQLHGDLEMGESSDTLARDTR
jgi:RNA polymerase sigma-70 factor (ECF subfamily)